MNIILPVAGKSSRFVNLRPKWLLTNPSGNLMIVDAICGMQLDSIESLYIIYLREHEEKYQFKSGLVKNLTKYQLNSLVNFIELDKQTENQVQTIILGLKQINKNISFIIKDGDNSFKLNDFNLNDNFVSYCRIENYDGNDIKSKSYLQLDDTGNLINIAEKNIISNKFCCGAYFFKHSDEFLKYSYDIYSSNIFVSDVIFNMILHGKKFIGLECSNYEDWGTLTEWQSYRQKFKTLFIDIDGIIFNNVSAYLSPFIEEAVGLTNNINHIKNLLSTGKIEIIFTTSRPEEYRYITEIQLKNVGLTYKELIMGLQHNQRIIINDFSNSNPYKSCDSINILRNSDELKNYI